MNLHPKIKVNELLGVLDTLKGENNWENEVRAKSAEMMAV